MGSVILKSIHFISELDALLIQQEASHLVCCIALGGVSKKPDVEMHGWLQ